MYLHYRSFGKIEKINTKPSAFWHVNYKHFVLLCLLFIYYSCNNKVCTHLLCSMLCYHKLYFHVVLHLHNIWMNGSLLFWDTFASVFFKKERRGLLQRQTCPSCFYPWGDIFHSLPHIPSQVPAGLVRRKHIRVSLIVLFYNRGSSGGLVWWFSLA